MSTTERLANELAFHDEQAQSRRDHFTQHPEDLAFDDDAYLRHETWIAQAFDLLGNVRDRRLLDLGCGHGMASLLLARRGALVTALELSPWYLEEALLRAQVNSCGDRICFVQASAEQLPFADGSFDGVWGNAILHHLDLDRAARELRRVLKPDGVAVFCEPWGENVLLEWARRRLPYAGKQRSRDEQPLRLHDLTKIERYFADMRVRPFQLLSMARRIWPKARFMPALDRCDRVLLRHWPGLGRFCRYVVISFHNRAVDA